MREFALLELPRGTLANGFSLVLARKLALESLKDDELSRPDDLHIGETSNVSLGSLHPR